GPRDRLSQAFVKELERGRTTKGPYGPVVHLDLRHLGERLINQKLPFVRELCLKYEVLDPVTDLIPVRPVIHYMMGGISTDIDGATPLPGLFAAGECACVSINGANRLGSNSLPEILVFGARAGKAAAEFAEAAPDGISAAIVAQANDERRRLEQDFLHKSAREASRSTIIRARSTRNYFRRWNSRACWMSQPASYTARCIAQSRVVHISGPTFQSATIATSSRTRSSRFPRAGTSASTTPR